MQPAPAGAHPTTPSRAITTIVLLLLAALLVPAATGAPPAAPPAGPDGPAEAVPGRLLVTVAAGADVGDVLARGRAALTSGERPVAEVTVRRLTDAVGLVEVPDEDRDRSAERLRDVVGVVDAEPDWLAEPMRSPDDPWFPKQWTHGRTGAQGAWDRTTGSPDVLVAVVDTGMHGDHPDLRANIVGQADTSTGQLAGGERVRVDNDTCDLGHGTWVGGVVGATGNNGADVAGVAWRVGLLDIATNSTRAGATCDGIPFSAIVAGIDHAVNRAGGPADVINLSLGGYLDRCPTAAQTAITAARNRNAVVVASVGNGQSTSSTAGRTAYPAGCDGVIGVGASNVEDGRAVYSQVNGSVDLVAPGGDSTVGGVEGVVLTTNHAFTTNRLTRVQGTSFSAPYVAGAAALVRSVQPLAGPDSLQSLLEGTARDLGPAGRDDQFGHGIVRVGAAVAQAVGTLPDAPEPTDPTAPREGTDAEGDTPPAPGPTVERISSGSSPTRPIPTAVAISREAFPVDGASHAVLARDDVFADALAGSTLGGGTGPLLFTTSRGPLANATESELRRVLEPGATVYLLGGPQALPRGLEDRLRQLELRPVRLAGDTREDTAARIAAEVDRRVGDDGTRPSAAILATSGTWPDAATAGSLGATFDIPIVLTPPDRLDPATRRYLERRRPRTLYVAGGPAAISDATARAAAASGRANVARLAGASRLETAVAVAQEYDRLYRARTGEMPRVAVGVNMFRSDAWSYVLAGSAFSGQSSGVYVPLEGLGGEGVASAASTYLQRRYRAEDRVMGAVVGGGDLVAGAAADRLERLLRGE